MAQASASLTIQVRGKPPSGHWCSVNSTDTVADAVSLAQYQNVVGIQRRWMWASLEPTEDQYSFTSLMNYLDELAKVNRHLVMMIEDKSFATSTTKNPIPPYLSAFVAEQDRNPGTYCGLRWKPYYIERYKALLRAIAGAVGNHPAFAGVCLQETAMSFSGTLLSTLGYSPTLYRDAYINVLTSAAKAMPAHHVFWYANFFPSGAGYTPNQATAMIGDVADAVAPHGVHLGGPDILPGHPPLSIPGRLYDLMRQRSGVLPLFCSAQNDSYSVNLLEDGAETPTSGGVNGYWTPEDIFLWAVNPAKLGGLQNIFWNHKEWRSDDNPNGYNPANSFIWTDAVPTIAAHPSPW